MWTHNLDPEIIGFLNLSVRWYGLMYVMGFFIGGQILFSLSNNGFLSLNKKEVDSLLLSLVVALLVGARLAYVFIYGWDYHRDNLFEIFSFWKGGLSFHGAIIAFLVTIYFWSRKKNIPGYQLMDSISLAGALGVGLGRIGNFINGELYGRITGGQWGVIFPRGGPYPRHPSQLYEAFFEGLMIFLILWFLKKRVKRYGVISACYVFLYSIFRYFIEFFREADQQMGYYFNGTTTMGQILCMVMFILAIVLYWHGKRLNHPIQGQTSS